MCLLFDDLIHSYFAKPEDIARPWIGYDPKRGEPELIAAIGRGGQGRGRGGRGRGRAGMLMPAGDAGPHPATGPRMCRACNVPMRGHPRPCPLRNAAVGV
jgi:hypothetical protein